MKLLYRTLRVAGVLLFLNGCSTKAGLFISANVNPLPPSKVVLSDGYKGTYYTLSPENDGNADTLLFFFGGSGHASLNYYLRSYFHNIDDKVKVFALQKRYVEHGETGLFEASEQFHQYNVFPQLVQDQKDFVDFVLKSENKSGKHVVLFGVSEGGNVAAALAAKIPQITHLIILGSGGMKGIDEFRIWGKRNNVDFDRLYQDVKKYPDSVERKAIGQTYKYWASFLPVDPMDYFRNIDIPVLVAMGEKDESVPVESVRFLEREYVRLGKKNLLVKIYADCDHVLMDSKGKSHREELLRFAYDWWSSR